MLKPVDCQIWGLVQQCMYKTAVHIASDLKLCLTHTRANVSQNIIDEAVDQ